MPNKIPKLQKPKSINYFICGYFFFSIPKPERNNSFGLFKYSMIV